MAKKSRRKKQTHARIPVVIRAFEGLAQEGDLIAMREFVSSGTAAITLKDGRRVRLVTLLPGAGAGLVRPDGEVWVALQVAHNHGDISRDLAHVLELASEVEPGNPIKMTTPVPGARLQDLIEPGAEFTIEVHEDFNWWLSDEERDQEAAAAALQAVNDGVWQTTKLSQVESAWATDMGDHTYLRWAMPWADEDQLLNAFARLKAAGTETISPGTKLIGMFRAHGVLVPVWEIDEADFAEVDSAAPAFKALLETTLGSSAALSSTERSARQELVSRQVTIR
ncbi:MAG: topoisomerase II [Actinomycetales bacterium]|nr:topoisomerase II [Actinomycetales bacterium]